MTPLFITLSSLFLLAGATNDTNFLHREKRQSRCTYSHSFLNVGDWINLRNEGSPYNYPVVSDCRYTISSPKGTQILLECKTFNVEYSHNCQKAKFFWSRTGDSSFRDWRFSCGTTPIRDTSTGNLMTIGFLSYDDELHSRNEKLYYNYSCTLTVQAAPCSTPCGLTGVSNRIVNGLETQPAEFPHRVAVYNLEQRAMFCAATIISPWYCLTAAHCLNELESTEKIYVDIGDHDLRTTNDAANELIYVEERIIHPSYNATTNDHDVGLLKLSRPITFTRNIQPVCLPWKYVSSDLGGTFAWASGWGLQYFGGPQSDRLQKIQVPTFPTQKCQEIYKGKIKITNNMFCAGGEDKDTCQSDSGGSLDYWDMSLGRYYALGIVSFGLDCAVWGYPGIYTKITNYLPWIEQRTGENFCKA